MSANWRASNDFRVGCDAQGAMASVNFFAPGALPDVRAAADNLIDLHVRRPLRERVRGLDSLRRLGQLLADAAAVDQEARALDVSIRRADSQRSEALELAAPGFSGVVADLDRELADLRRGRQEVARRQEAIAGPVSAARQVAAAELTSIHGGQCHAACRSLHDDFLRAQGALAGRVGELLTALAATQMAAQGATQHSVTQDVIKDVDGLARAAAGAQASQPAAAPAAGLVESVA